ncbi:MAG: response regulator [Negativicutes bacterium]|jgi:CheY-like chemotaxis protein
MDNIVLFVDDEVHILSSIKRAVFEEKFKSLFASSAKEALEIMEKNDVSVVVADMKMPKMDGLTFLKIVKETRPEIIRMVLSGYTVLPQVLAAINQADIFKFITKPWDMEEDLLGAVRQAVDYYNLYKERDRLKETLQHRNVTYQKVLRDMEVKLAMYKKNIDIIKELSSWEQNKPSDPDLEALKELKAILIRIMPIVKANFDIKEIVDGAQHIFNESNVNCRFTLTEQGCNSYNLSAFNTFIIFVLSFIASKLDKVTKKDIYCELGCASFQAKHQLTAKFQIDWSLIAESEFAELESCLRVLAKLCAYYDSQLDCRRTRNELLIVFVSDIK